MLTDTYEAGGHVDKFLVEAFPNTGKYAINAITPSDSTNELSFGVNMKIFNYDD
jgi:hypothetical protein